MVWSRQHRALRGSGSKCRYRQAWVRFKVPLTTNARNRHLEPCYKQHAAVDDKAGVILDVEVTTGEKNEGEMLTPKWMR